MNPIFMISLLWKRFANVFNCCLFLQNPIHLNAFAFKTLLHFSGVESFCTNLKIMSYDF